MAKGADDDYWSEPNLPSTIKHCILGKYLPIFLARTSTPGRRVVMMDGYAGRGAYMDGTPGSAGMMLKMAFERKHASPPADYILRFFENDPKSYATLKTLVEEYVAKGVNVTAERVDVLTRVHDVVDEAAGLPLFLFVDPTGVGLPFHDLVATLNRLRNARGWPPTEALINFSYAAIRRIGGHVKSPKGNEKTLQRLDEAVGGDWWRECFVDGVTDEAVDEVVAGFIERLGSAPLCHVVASIPVRPDEHLKPLYSLVFFTRNRRPTSLVNRPPHLLGSTALSRPTSSQRGSASIPLPRW